MSVHLRMKTYLVVRVPCTMAMSRHIIVIATTAMLFFRKRIFFVSQWRDNMPVQKLRLASTTRCVHVSACVFVSVSVSSGLHLN